MFVGGRAHALITSVALAVGSVSARGDELPTASEPAKDLPLHPDAANPPRHKGTLSDETFKYRPAVDFPIVFGAAGTWIVLALLKNQLSSSCRWCETNPNGTDGVNAFDRGARNTFKWANPAAASTISDVSTFAVIPVFVLGIDLITTGSPRRWARWGVDLILISEAAAISGALNYVVKYAVARERPYVHYEKLSGTPFQSNADDTASFFSGHSTFAFAVASSAGTVASLRHYPLAPLIWTVGMGLATFSGYLRVAADKHYLSDVMVGALVGSAVGATVPLAQWIRPLREKKIALGAQTNASGAIISLNGHW